MAKKIQTLNIGAATVAFAEYEAGPKGSLALTAYATAPLAAPVDAENAATVLGPALGEIVSAAGVRPGRVSISISGQMAFQRFAGIPAKAGDDRFEQLVRYEVEQNVPFPIDEMVCDRQALGETENGETAVMIVAAKTDQVEALTSAVQAAGFSPEAVEVAPIALVNAVRAASGDDASCVVILDVGAKTTSLSIVEGDKIYNRSIPVAGNAISKEISAALGCSLDEAEALKREAGYVALGGVTEDDDATADRVSKVCRAVLTRLNAEISRSINFYRSQQGGSAPVRLYLTGGTALLPQIDVFFADSLGVEVVFFSPFETIAVGPKVDAAALEADAALLASTAGLALNRAGRARFDVNLLPPSLVEERENRAKIPYVAAAGVALVLGLVLAGLGVRSDVAALEARRDAVAAKASGLAALDAKVKKAAAALAAEKASADAFARLLYGRAAAAVRLAAVRSSLESGMWIDRWENGRVTVRYWKDRVKESAGRTAGERVADKLKGKPSVVPESVKMLDMSVVGRDKQLAQFTVEVKFK